MKPIDEGLVNRVLDYVTKYQQENGVSPTYRKIQKDMKISSLSVVHRYVDLLKNRNLLEASESGGIEIFKNLQGSKTKLVPLLGSVVCGEPLLAVENIQGNYKLPREILGAGEHFMLKSQGDSMIEAGIFEGDLLIVKKQSFAEQGDIVVALIGDEATVKRFLRKNGEIILHPENEYMEDIVVKDCQILGVVEGMIRQFKR